MTSRVALLTMLLAVPGLPSSRAADELPAFKVVVNADNSGSAIKRETLADIFLKRSTRWNDGVATAPVDQSLTSKLRAAFSSRVLHQSPAAVHNYWQRQIFSGREQPPPVKPTDAEVFGFVVARPGAIGYVSEGAILPSGVKELKLVD
jgi:ABC-type phosphate transport system substrate-binding protein